MGPIPLVGTSYPGLKVTLSPIACRAGETGKAGVSYCCCLDKFKTCIKECFEKATFTD